MLVIDFDFKYMMLKGVKLVKETISVVVFGSDFKSRLTAIMGIVDIVTIYKLAIWFKIIELSMDSNINLVLMDYP